MQKIVQVAGAVIYKNHRFLLAQRHRNDHFGGLWEFPGGTIEEDESSSQCVVREIKEELGLSIRVLSKLSSFVDEIKELRIDIDLFYCEIVRGDPQCLDCQNCDWFDFDQIAQLPLAPADRKIYAWMKEQSALPWNKDYREHL